MGSGSNPFGTSAQNMKTLADNAKLFAAYLEKAKKDLSDVTKNIQAASGGSSGGIPLAPISGSRGGGFSMGKAAGFGLGTVAAVGSTMYNALPAVADAVSQRMALQQVASFSGKGYTPASILNAANAANRGGFTSAQGMSESAAAFMGMGYSFGSRTVSNNMGQIGGMSVMSGLANEQVAAGISSINGMNFLRVGIQARNPDGSLKPINQIASSLYGRMYGGRKVTAEQAAAVFRTNSVAYQNILRVTGGDPNLTRMMQTYIAAQAKNGGMPINTNNPEKVMDLMGWSKNSPERAQFKLSSSEARQLQATGESQVAGYTGALNAAAKLTDGFTDLYNKMGPVADAFAKMQGFAQTFPHANNVAGSVANTASSLIGSGLSLGTNILGARYAAKYLEGKGVKGAGMAGKAIKGAGVVGMGINAAASAVQGYQAEKFSWGQLAASAGSGALTGLMTGNPWGVLAGALIGAGTYGMGYAASHHGGGAPDMASQGAITTPYGKKGNMWKWKGYHTGVDYAGKMGDPVYAKANGTVSGDNAGKSYGIHVLVLHDDGTQGLYAHLSSKTVRAGQRVSAGQLIGKIGSTGNSSGPHLHFELRRGRNNPVKPDSWLSKLGGAVKNAFNKVTNFVSNVWGNLTGQDSLGTASSASTSTGTPTNTWDMSKIQGIGSLRATDLSSIVGQGPGAANWDGIKSNGARSDAATLIDPGTGNKGTGGKLNASLVRTLSAAGFKGKGLQMAYAVAMAEGNSSVHTYRPSTGDDSYGMFQINFMGDDLRKSRNRKLRQKVEGYKNPSSLLDRDVSARAAYYMSGHGENWSSWSTFKNDRYKQFLPSQQQVASVLGGQGGGQPDGDGGAGIVVHAKFEITAQNSSTTEAAKLAKHIAESLEKELRNAKISRS